MKFHCLAYTKWLNYDYLIDHRSYCTTMEYVSFYNSGQTNGYRIRVNRIRRDGQLKFSAAIVLLIIRTYVSTLYFITVTRVSFYVCFSAFRTDTTAMVATVTTIQQTRKTPEFRCNPPPYANDPKKDIGSVRVNPLPAKSLFNLSEFRSSYYVYVIEIFTCERTDFVFFFF